MTAPPRDMATILRALVANATGTKPPRKRESRIRATLRAVTHADCAATALFAVAMLALVIA